MPFHIFLPILVLVFSVAAFGKDLQVIAGQAAVYDAPDGAKVEGLVLQKGKKLVTKEPLQKGFYQLSTKSGRPLFIRASDVKVLGGADINDLEEAKPRDTSGLYGLRISYDLGFSSGSSGNSSYSEGALGFNFFFARYFSLREAVFARFAAGVDNIYGLDSSVRGILHWQTSGFGASAFAGPGFRFVNKGKDVPFAEAGLTLQLAGIQVGGGMKTFFTKWRDANASNDTQYFIILAGGGSL